MTDDDDHDRKTGDVGGAAPKPDVADQAREKEGQRPDENGQAKTGANPTGGPGGTGGSVL